MENKILNIKGDCSQTLKSDTNLNILDSCTIGLTIASNKSIKILSFLENEKNINVKLNIKVEPGAKLYFNNIDINKMENNIDIKVELEEGSFAKVNNVVIKKGISSKYTINLINNAPFTKGYISQKGVVISGGQAILNAVGDIKKQAFKSENLQESRVLLLDNASGGEASPLLLIDNNEIIAGHKASVSKVDEEQLYYLQTRGISKKQSERLLTQAFVKPLLDEMQLSQEEVDIIIKKELLGE